MASQYLLALMLVVTHNMMLHCASAAVHSHSLDTHTPEREVDGSYRPRDSDHYGDSGHNPEFDHEAILGSVKEADDFDRLPVQESRRRLEQLLPKMDLNGDHFVDRMELKKWILNSFRKLSLEEAQERLSEADANRDGVVSWAEYLQDSFGVDSEDEVGNEDTGDTGMLLNEEKEMWAAVDKNKDGVLDINEFEVFATPEEHEEMHPFLLKQTLREKDKNKDGFIDFKEYVADRSTQQDREWTVTERDKFEQDLDLDHDGRLDTKEILAWVVPDNEEIADEEVDHLFSAADENHDDKLSYEEILQNQDVFVGSEATDYGNDLMGDEVDHFNDEL